MERRLLKDFHIGIVEGIVNEIQQNLDEPKNVFGQIAKVLGRRTTFKSKKKDWNELVRKNTQPSNPIGSAQEAEESRNKRQSLRRYIVANVNQPVQIEDEKLIGKYINKTTKIILFYFNFKIYNASYNIVSKFKYWQVTYFPEYNPKLVEVPRGARVAYAKFMSKKIEEDYKKLENEPPNPPKDPNRATVKFKGIQDYI